MYDRLDALPLYNADLDTPDTLPASVAEFRTVALPWTRCFSLRPTPALLEGDGRPCSLTEAEIHHRT